MDVRGQHGRYSFEDAFSDFGGAAHIHACGDSQFVYKQYKKPEGQAVEISRIKRLCARGREILINRHQAIAATPEASINWPIDLVLSSSGAVAGVVLPAIPDAFRLEDGSFRTFDHLFLARAKPPGPEMRVSVLIRLAETFAWLESQSLFHGDLSVRNVVWTPHPRPIAYVIDADGLREVGSLPEGGFYTPYWIDPRLVDGRIRSHDDFSDRYALALAMYRALFLNPGNLEKVEGRWPPPTEIPEALDQRVRRLLESSLSHPLEPRERATAAMWAQCLLDVYVKQAGFDQNGIKILENHAQKHRQRFSDASSRPGILAAQSATVVHKVPPRNASTRRTAVPPASANIGSAFIIVLVLCFIIGMLLELLLRL
jgi:hypothetical protein